MLLNKFYLSVQGRLFRMKTFCLFSFKGVISNTVEILRCRESIQAWISRKKLKSVLNFCSDSKKYLSQGDKIKRDRLGGGGLHDIYIHCTG
jgi:hypothetical protein